jgi:hypothetical protein
MKIARTLAVLAAALLSGGPARADGDAPEYVVKAAYLSKLGDYVEWPPAAFATAASPVTLCVAGDDPFGAALETNAAGQLIAGRAVVIRRLKTVDRGAVCQILYVGGSDQQNVAQALEAVRGMPVLTVTDEARGTATGVVHFVVKDKRVRFTIDDEAASLNGLKISSKLFGLALSVRPRK